MEGCIVGEERRNSRADPFATISNEVEESEGNESWERSKKAALDASRRRVREGMELVENQMLKDSPWKSCSKSKNNKK